MNLEGHINMNYIILILNDKEFNTNLIIKIFIFKQIICSSEQTIKMILY